MQEIQEVRLLRLPAFILLRIFFQKLKRRAKNAAENAVGNKIENAINNGIDKATSKKDRNSSKGNDNSNDYYDDAEQQDNAYVNDIQVQKSDFVPGDIVMFEDKVSGEQLGEFPSKWDLERGNAEIAMINGQQAIAMDQSDSWISPLIIDPATGAVSKNYLGD